MDFQMEFNRHVQAAIAHTHDEDKKLILEKLLCRDDDDCQPEASTLDSGGGGNTNPPQPGTPTPPTRPK